MQGRTVDNSLGQPSLGIGSLSNFERVFGHHQKIPVWNVETAAIGKNDSERHERLLIAQGF